MVKPNPDDHQFSYEIGCVKSAVLPGYNGKTHLAPALPGWPSLAPGRSEEV